MQANEVEAYAWGIKAAREGLRIDANPYNSETLRQAWKKGFSISETGWLTMANHAQRRDISAALDAHM